MSYFDDDGTDGCLMVTRNVLNQNVSGASFMKWSCRNLFRCDFPGLWFPALYSMLKNEKQKSDFSLALNKFQVWESLFQNESDIFQNRVQNYLQVRTLQGNGRVSNSIV